jgi:hypothetical protein
MIIEDDAFSLSYDLAPPSSPTPRPPFRQQVASLSQSSCLSPVELTDGRGGEEVGEEPNKTKARKPGPL